MTVVADYPIEKQRAEAEALVRQLCPEAADDLLRTPWLSDDVLVLVGTVSGVLLGFARAERISNERMPAGTFVLRALMVAADQRERGIGRGMVAALKDELSNHEAATHLATLSSEARGSDVDVDLCDVRTKKCAALRMSRDDARELGFYL